MRVLLGCSLGGDGHLIPLARVGHRVARAGHEVLLLVPPAMAPGADRVGLPYRVGDEPPRAFVAEIWQRVRAGPPDAVAGLIDRELFADRCTTAMLPAARTVRDDWRPDFVVRDPCEYATAVAAHEGGLGHAQIGVSLASIEWGVRAMVAPIVDRRASGVAAAIASSPYLTSFPPSLDASPWPDTRRFRLAVGTTEAAPEPFVYVTFGTVLAHLVEATEVYRAALQAVAGLPARVLLTVGHAADPDSLGPVPENVQVEQWVAQDAVLERAALVVCHGGAGTTFGALAAGVPVVICPLFADQARNGRAVQDAGAGVVVAGAKAPAGGLRALTRDDVPALRDAIEQVLDEPRYRQAASRVAAEMAALPALDDVVGQLLGRGP